MHRITITDHQTSSMQPYALHMPSKTWGLGTYNHVIRLLFEVRFEGTNMRWGLNYGFPLRGTRHCC